MALKPNTYIRPRAWRGGGEGVIRHPIPNPTGVNSARVGGRVGRVEAYGVTRREPANSADLGGSSDYICENHID